MVDGSLQNKGLHLNTYGFTSSDVTKFKTTVENMLGENSIRCSILKHIRGPALARPAKRRYNLYLGRKHGVTKKNYFSVHT